MQRISRVYVGIWCLSTMWLLYTVHSLNIDRSLSVGDSAVRHLVDGVESSRYALFGHGKRLIELTREACVRNRVNLCTGGEFVTRSERLVQMLLEEAERNPAQREAFLDAARRLFESRIGYSYFQQIPKVIQDYELTDLTKNLADVTHIDADTGVFIVLQTIRATMQAAVQRATREEAYRSFVSDLQGLLAGQALSIQFVPEAQLTDPTLALIDIFTRPLDNDKYEKGFSLAILDARFCDQNTLSFRSIQTKGETQYVFAGLIACAVSELARTPNMVPSELVFSADVLMRISNIYNTLVTKLDTAYKAAKLASFARIYTLSQLPGFTEAVDAAYAALRDYFSGIVEQKTGQQSPVDNGAPGGQQPEDDLNDKTFPRMKIRRALEKECPEIQITKAILDQAEAQFDQQVNFTLRIPLQRGKKELVAQRMRTSEPCIANGALQMYTWKLVDVAEDDEE